MQRKERESRDCEHRHFDTRESTICCSDRISYSYQTRRAIACESPFNILKVSNFIEKANYFSDLFRFNNSTLSKANPLCPSPLPFCFL